MPTAQDIMTSDVVTVNGNASVAEAVSLMKQHGVRTLVVERREEADAYGIITQRDIVYRVVAQRKDPAAVKVHEVMTIPLVVVNKDLAVKYVARLLANTGLSRAPVIFDKKIQGIVSVSDIVNKAM